MSEVEEEAYEEAVNLEDELIEHLALPESAEYIYRERIGEEFLTKREKDARALLVYVIAHIEEHGVAPAKSAILYELGGQFDQPKQPVTWLVQQLRERFERNRVKEAVTRLAAAVVEDPHEALRIGLRDLGDISRAVATQDRRLTALGDWERGYEDYKHRVLKGALRGLSFGFPELDDAVGGLRPKNMVFVCGRPKHYKSWFLLKPAVANMLEGARIHFETMELGEQQMYGRFQCMVAGVNYRHYQMGTMTADEMEAMAQAGEILRQGSGDINFVHAHPTERTIKDVEARAKEWGADAVMLDQFSFITPLREYHKKNETDAATVYDIKDATEYCPFYVAAQFNREAASLTEMADLAQIGLTDAIGQASDMVFGLYRNKEMWESRLIEFGTIAAREAESVRGLIKIALNDNSNMRWVETRADA